MMTDKLREAALMALDAMKLARGDHGTVMLAYSAIDPWLYHRVDERLDAAIKAVEDALAEPAIKDSLTTQRPWVGLTDEEINLIPDGEYMDFYTAIEAKLRNKNT
jgi:hypothetical protein